MNMSGISLLGCFHGLACSVALIAGTLVIFGRKGTPNHRLLGRVYAYAMLLANLAIFGVYHFDIARFVPFRGGANIFGLFHWEAVATLVFLALGMISAPRQHKALWAYIHPVSMLITYYLLVGGFINQLFLRVTVLRAGYVSGTSPAVGLLQMATMLMFLTLLVLFVVQVARRRRKQAPAKILRVKHA